MGGHLAERGLALTPAQSDRHYYAHLWLSYAASSAVHKRVGVGPCRGATQGVREEGMSLQIGSSAGQGGSFVGAAPRWQPSSNMDCWRLRQLNPTCSPGNQY